MPESTTTSKLAHRMVKATDEFFGYYPGSVAVVTTGHAGRRNVMSAGWHTALSAKPPLYGVAIAPERHSYELLRLSGRFGVNFLSFDLAEAIAGAGLLTGADGSDKFASLSLDWYETAAGLPLLSSAYLAYACTVKQQVVTGDHDFFIGDVTHVHFDPLAFDLRVKSRERQPAVIYHGRSLYEAATGGPTKLILPETIRNKNSSGGNR